MGGRAVNNQRGITLIVVLVMIVILGLSAGLAGQTMSSLVQREREAELLWRGDQYRKAIASYFSSAGQGGAGLQAYPLKLEDLLRDPRSLATKRHLRRLYIDPMTGEPFQILKDPAGRLNGVRSASENQPFQQDGFPIEYQDFKDAEKYSAWEFRYTPPKVQPGTVPPGTVPPGTVPPGTVPPGTVPPGSVPAPKPGGENPFGDQGWPEGWTPWKMPGK